MPLPVGVLFISHLFQREYLKNKFWFEFFLFTTHWWLFEFCKWARACLLTIVQERFLSKRKADNSFCRRETDAHLNFSDWCSMIKMWFPELYYYILTNLSVYMQEIWKKQICIQCYNHLCTIAHGVIVAKVCQNVTFIICNFTLYYDCCQGPWIEGFEFFWLLGFL